MGLAKVLDTGVLLGVTIEKDAHHELCYEYVTKGGPCYITPTVDDEFSNKEEEIRGDLHSELTTHRTRFISEVDSDALSPGAIDWVRSNLLDRDEMDSFRYLEAYYQKKRKEARYRRLDKLEVSKDLEDMEMEVWEDAAEDEGGYESLITYWEAGVDEYPEVKRNLLIYEGDDCDVCLEAHHVATCIDDDTELGTTNKKHFIDTVAGEPMSREENILAETDLDSIRNLAWDGSV